MKILYHRTHHQVVNLAPALLSSCYFILICFFNLSLILSLTFELFLCSELIIYQADPTENRVLPDQGLNLFGVVYNHHGLVSATASLLGLQVTGPVEGAASLHSFLLCISIFDSVEAAVLRIDFGQVEGAGEQVVDLALK